MRLHNGGIYSGDRRLVLGNERNDEQIHEDDARQERPRRAPGAFAGDTIEFIRSESPLLIDGMRASRHRRRREPRARRGGDRRPERRGDLKAIKPVYNQMY